MEDVLILSAENGSGNMLKIMLRVQKMADYYLLFSIVISR